MSILLTRETPIFQPQIPKRFVAGDYEDYAFNDRPSSESRIDDMTGIKAGAGNIFVDKLAMNEALRIAAAAAAAVARWLVIAQRQAQSCARAVNVTRVEC